MESHDAPSQSTHPTPKVPLAGTKHKSSLSKISLPSLDAMTRDQVSRYALTASIDGGGFEDVKFFAFSRRNSKGRAFAPMSLFGNSTCIRKTAPHFDVVLTQGFAESIIADLNMAYPRDRPAALDSYDYPDDSDMDDVDDEDIALEGEGGDRAPSHEDDCSGASESVRLLSDETCRDTGSGRPGRVIFIEDMAFQTWRALIYYSYFGSIEFAPLKSAEKLVTDKESTSVFSPPKCSPKSMYRLADKYDIKELKNKALQDIKSKLTPDNVFAELFSAFTSLHSEVQEHEVDYLHSILENPKVMQELPLWIDYLAQGRLPVGATKAISSLISKLAKPRLPITETGKSRCSCGRAITCKYCNRTV